MQWAHFVPAYDTWLDNTYVKQWGEKNDVEVKIDHINNALLDSTRGRRRSRRRAVTTSSSSSPRRRRSRSRSIPSTTSSRRSTKKLGPMYDGRQEVHLQPEDEEVLRLPRQLRARPGPVPAEHLWSDAGVSPNTWDDMRKAAPKLKAAGHPVGLGMSNELDSNMC